MKTALRPRYVRSRLVAALLALVAAPACNALWGIDALDYRGGQAAGTGGVGGAGGLGGAAASGLGASGGSGPCEPDASESCYSGPPQTRDLGACQSGQRTCDAGSHQWGPCAGEVLPSIEICGNAVDEDCDDHVSAATECLANSGLIVRYFMDEAASGQAPAALLDAAPAPLPLSIDYAGTSASYCESDGHRGLCWLVQGSAARASAAVDGTKISSALNGSTGGTIELVVDMTGANYDRLSHVATNAGGDFSLGLSPHYRLGFAWHGGEWPVDWTVALESLGRVVLHLVLDTTQGVPADRVKLYVDGTALTPALTTPPAQNDTIALQTNGLYVLGNYFSGAGSIQGAIDYAAMYSLPLTDTEVANNASMLAIDDDSPP